jgi:hypothetical protein
MKNSWRECRRLPSFAATLGIAAAVLAASIIPAEAQSPTSPYPTGEWPESLAVGDFDGNGTLDLAVTNLGSDNVSVLLGFGDGTFAAAQSYLSGIMPTSVATADFTGDGILDLAVSNFHTYVPPPPDPDNPPPDNIRERDGEYVFFLPGIGDGTFERVTNRLPDPNMPEDHHFEVQVQGRPWSIAAGDLDGNGTPDLAVTHLDSDSVSAILLSPELFQKGYVEVGADVRRLTAGDGPTYVAVSDVDDDDALDLVAANRFSDDVSVLLGAGDGTFADQQRFAAGNWPSSIAVSDFDGNGTLDLAVTNFWSGDVSMLPGAGDGTFADQQRVALGDWPSSVAVADFDGNSTADLTVASFGYGNGHVSMLLGLGDGTFADQQLLESGSGPRAVTVADFDDNGTPDIAIANSRSDNVSVVSVRLNYSTQDNDGDGYSQAEGDCDDGNVYAHPGASEICGNDVDENCQGSAPACESCSQLDPDCETWLDRFDIDGSGRIDGFDLASFSRFFPANRCTSPTYDRRGDFDLDCAVDGFDHNRFGESFGMTCPP